MPTFFFLPLTLVIGVTVSTFSASASTSLAEMPIERDDYTDALSQLGFNVSSVDSRPYNPMTDVSDTNYAPQERFIIPVQNQQLGFTNYTPNEEETGDYLFYQIDPYGLSEGELRVEDNSYIDNQSDLKGEGNIASFGHGTYGKILRSNIHQSAFLFNKEAPLVANGEVILELRQTGDAADLVITFDTKHGRISNKLLTQTGSNWPRPSKNRYSQKHKLDSVLIDSDKDGFSELLVASYNGKIYTFVLADLEDASSHELAASYYISPSFPQSGIGNLSLAKGEFKSTPGEQLIFLKRSYTHESNNYPGPSYEYCSYPELRVVNLGTTNYNTLIHKTNLESFGNYCPVAIGSANIKRGTSEQLVIGGIGSNGTGQGLFHGPKLWLNVFDIQEHNDHDYSTHLFGSFDWSENKWKTFSFQYQTSLAAADLLGVDQDYIAYASRIFVYDPTRSNKLSSVGRWDLGEGPNVGLEWRVGNFSDDFSEYTTTNKRIGTKPTQSQLVRSEGEEFILARVDRDNDKYSLRTIQLIDIDNNTFEQIENLDGSQFGYKAGVNVLSIPQPEFFPTSRVTIATYYDESFPSFTAVDPNKTSVTGRYIGGHEVKLSAPSLVEAMDPVPYYSGLFNSMSPKQELYNSSEEGDSYSLTSTSSAGVDISGMIPLFSYAMNSTTSEIFSYQTAASIKTSSLYGNTLGGAFLHIEITPFDSYNYKILTAPSELASEIGGTSPYMFPRDPLSSYVDLSTYNSVNDSLGGKLFTYDHLFAPQGVLQEYPNSSQIEVAYPDAVLGTAHTIPSSPENYLELTVEVSTYLDGGHGSGESLSRTTGIGGAFKGFGFTASRTYASGLEALSIRSWEAVQGYRGIVYGVEANDEYPLYDLGIYLAKDSNVEGAKDNFVKAGFFVD